MKEYIEKLVLQTINNNASIMPLFKVGYAYSQVLSWCMELEENGLIGWSEDDIRKLTVLGEKRLEELQVLSEKVNTLIIPLNQYKVERQGIEEIYLP